MTIGAGGDATYIASLSSEYRQFLNDTLFPMVAALSPDLLNKPTSPISVAGLESFTDRKSFVDSLLTGLGQGLNTVLSLFSGSANAGDLDAAIQQTSDKIRNANETIILRPGSGPNPFDAAGGPGDVNATASASINEKGTATFTLYLPYAAGTGGQRIKLQLTGSAVSAFDAVATSGLFPLGVDGSFEVIIHEGQKQATFALAELRDVNVSETLGLTATLLGSDGVPTHGQHMEVNLALAAIQEPLELARPGFVIGTEGADTVDPFGVGIDGTYQTGTPGSISVLEGGLGGDIILRTHTADEANGGGGNDWIGEGDPDPRFPEGEQKVDGGEDNDLIHSIGGPGELRGGGGNDLIDGITSWSIEADPDGLGNAFFHEIWGALGTVFSPSFSPAAYQASVQNGNGETPIFQVTDWGSWGIYEDNSLALNPKAIFADGSGTSWGYTWSTSTVNGVTRLEFAWPANGASGIEHYTIKTARVLLPTDKQVGLTIDGGDGNDALIGAADKDVIVGGAGSDMIEAGGGNDTVFGDIRLEPSPTGQVDGDDQIALGSGDDSAQGGGGNDLIWGEFGDDTVFGGSGNDVLYGDNGDGTTDGTDYLDGGADNDILYGAAGNDTLTGGDGDDILMGDYIYTSAADAGSDVLDGGDGADQLWGYFGNDTLNAGIGNDFVDGGAGADRISGGAGADELWGEQSDVADSDAGGDVIYGDAGNDSIMGGAGDDMIDGGTDNDGLWGGVGNDTILGGAGDDGLFGEVGNDALTAGGGNDSAHGNDGNDTLLGDAGTDSLYGEEGDDRIEGGRDADTLKGGAGADTLLGGEGTDYLEGGLGADTYVFNLGDGGKNGLGQVDTVIESGTDTTFVFGVGVARQDVMVRKNGTSSDLVVTYGGSDSFIVTNGSNLGSAIFRFADGTSVGLAEMMSVRLTGGSGPDTLQGSDDANDWLDGGAGADVMIGGWGNDTYVVDTPGDVVVESGPAGVQISRVSTNAGGQQGNYNYPSPYSVSPSISGDGRFVAFSSAASNLVLYDNNQKPDVFVKDLSTGAIVRASTTSAGVQATQYQDAIEPDLSADGNVVVFLSHSLDLVPGTADWGPSVFAKDLRTGQIQVASSSLEGVAVGGSNAALSSDGRFVLFRSFATNLSPSVTSAGLDQIYLKDLQSGNVSVVSASADGVPADSFAYAGSISNDGRYATFFSYAYNLVPNDEPGPDLFVKDMSSGSITRVDNTFSGIPSISGDARFVLVTDLSSQLVMRDLRSGSTSIVSSSTDGVIADQSADATRNGVSGDGRYVVFWSNATNLVPGDTNGAWDVLVKDTRTGRTARVSVAGDGGQANGNSLDASISDDGRYLTFDSAATNLVAGDTNNARDVFVVLNPLLDGGVNTGSVDTIKSFISYSLPENVENLELVGQGPLSGTGNELDNQIDGNASANDLNGLAGNDRLNGNAGTDTLSGGEGNDYLDGGADDDILVVEGNSGFDQLDGGLGNDIFTVAASTTGTVNITSADAVAGKIDTLRLGFNVADASIVQSDGDLRFSFQGSTATVIVKRYFATSGSTQIERIEFADGIVWLPGDVLSRFSNGTEGDDYIAGAATDDSIFGLGGNDIIEGRAGNDTLDGGSGSDTLRGQAGADVLTGSSGDDVLDGGEGPDRMLGNVGNDTYIVDDVADEIVEQLVEGTDSVQSSVSYTLSDNVENLMLTGTSAINGAGNALDNSLTGNSAANNLDGGAGVDTMIGGFGDDTYFVDVPGDVITEVANAGNDTVLSTTTYSLATNVENLTLIGTTAINGSGNTLNNTLAGNAALNTLAGGAGDDTYLVQSSDDVVVESAAEGTDLVLSGVTYVLSANVENLTLTGSAAISGTGNAMDNVLIGNSSTTRWTAAPVAARTP